jgi:hypothetical protein
LSNGSVRKNAPLSLHCVRGDLSSFQFFLETLHVQ